jgi:hypothetical protein
MSKEDFQEVHDKALALFAFGQVHLFQSATSVVFPCPSAFLLLGQWITISWMKDCVPIEYQFWNPSIRGSKISQELYLTKKTFCLCMWPSPMRCWLTWKTVLRLSVWTILILQRIEAFDWSHKEEMNLFENLHSFKVVEASDLISCLVFLLYNLFLFLTHCHYRQCIGIPMGTNHVVYLANFYLFSYEFDFLKHLLKNNTSCCAS